jgi:hypothetical protein
MKFIAVASAFTLVACSEHTLPVPTAPSPADPAAVAPAPAAAPVSRIVPAVVYATVIEKDGGGECIADATLQIVAGQHAGPQVFKQEPCDYWDPPGFTLKDLSYGESLTLRFSAPGFVSLELTTLPNADLTIRLSRIGNK